MVEVHTSSQTPGILYWSSLLHATPILCLLILSVFNCGLIPKLDSGLQFYSFLMEVVSNV